MEVPKINARIELSNSAFMKKNLSSLLDAMNWQTNSPEAK